MTDREIEAVATQLATALAANMHPYETLQRSCLRALYLTVPTIRRMILAEALDVCRAAVNNGESAMGVRDKLGALYLGRGK